MELMRSPCSLNGQQIRCRIHFRTELDCCRCGGGPGSSVAFQSGEINGGMKSFARE